MHWSAQSTQLSSHPQPAQEWRLFFCWITACSCGKQKGCCKKYSHRAEKKQPKTIAPMHKMARKEGYRCLFPPDQAFNCATLLSMNIAELLQMYTLESFHAGVPFSATSSPTFPMQKGLYHNWTHAPSQKTRRESAGLVLQGSRSLNYIERMVKHCKGISAILISPQPL